MVNLTLAVPKEMKSEMEQFPEINWSEVARQAIAQKLRDMQLLRKMRSKSTLTENEAVNLGRKLNKAMAKRLSRLDVEGIGEEEIVAMVHDWRKGKKADIVARSPPKR